MASTNTLPAVNRGSVLPLNVIDSDADFILLSFWEGVLSEHCTMGEARQAFFSRAAKCKLGDNLPIIYQRTDSCWTAVQ